MKHNKHSLSRRTFIKGVVASGAMLYGINLNASTDTVKKRKKTEELSGTVFHLTIDKTLVNVTGEPSYATAVNAMLQGPTLKWREGDTVTLHVTNNLQESASIHWHGIILPYQMDGVPGISYEGIAPGETFTYTFTVNQSGTFWYHSHSAFQEQTGVYGAIVIEPKKKDPYEYDKDYVVLLSDYSDEKPAAIYRKLKLFPDYYNFNRRTVGDFFLEVKDKGFLEAFKARQMWNKMRMSDRDLSDVTAYTYTFLMNGQNPATRFRALFQNGDKVRLRFINAAAMTFFDVRIPGLKMKVVAADGNNIQPVDVDEFRIGVAETYDVIVEPEDDKAYAIFAQSIARKGYALGNLSTDADILAEVPQMDPPQALTMLDMGMSKDMTQMKSMDMSKRDSMSSLKKPIPLTKLPIRWGVGTTMRAMNPQYRLDDPGVGLRNNGRKVLTYADLRSLRSTKEDRYPDREIVLHLTGNMERYMWSINGIPYHEAAPLEFHYGERLRITYINDTMMNHPMHLHGLWSDLETGDENHLVRKHTIISQPGSKISFRVTVDAKGAWAYHCHLLYHMTDMFRKVVVA
ncbi:copper resistance system multicopper oxidase [Sulfurimonas sp. SWIR-19]|uniref:copper resistance system multicopper oxidase n=1 Tax=Sulfurimonas sp. SWIR-19 TaxID=2878390 RepID=UPI001CF57695|nr:copper resistance system multicopper oxidase [Sulfurimonas sp. SWIR-19]UCN00225.1 copper resistance system multicopper oxidase [Sulfurimonas sp. SWIR-19]